MNRDLSCAFTNYKLDYTEHNRNRFSDATYYRDDGQGRIAKDSEWSVIIGAHVMALTHLDTVNMFSLFGRLITDHATVY